MANKKKKHRRPIAPPIHSAPGTSHSPSGPTPAAVAARPESPAAPAAPAPSRKQQRARSSLSTKRRRSRRRNYLILSSVVVLIIGAMIAQRVISGSAMSELNRLSKAAGGTELKVTADSGSGDHLGDGKSTAYEESPPTHGPHAAATVRAGVYDEPFSKDGAGTNTIYQAVHSLEHGAVIIWHKGLSKKDLSELERTYDDKDKIIVAPYPELEGDDHVVATAWGREIRMEKLSTAALDRFIDLFREARSAPEATVPI
ncbi:MAG: DUF3105 domain-containing protein [Actinomycetota bacterium]